MENLYSKEEENKTLIREQLGKLSFEELQKLKQNLGTKIYNEAIFGNSKRRKNLQEFQRSNKNRPREMSSKKPININKLNSNIKIIKPIPRDPRFDSLCGTFNEKAFKTAYSFVSDIKLKEREELTNDLKNESNPKRRDQIKYLIQRIDNQIREEKKIKMIESKKREEKEKNIELMKQGKNPYYQNKSEKRTLDLINKYNDLKKSGKIQKHLIKESKKRTKPLK